MKYINFKLKPLECEAVKFTGNNYEEIKHFCYRECIITYETCEVDDYWLVRVNDAIHNDLIVVPVGDYIVKFPDLGFIVVDGTKFEEWFEPID